jgi:hypothetical protein
MPNQAGTVTGLPGSQEGVEVVLHSWEDRILVLSNPAAWRGMVLCLGVGALGLALLFTVISKSIAGVYLSAGLFGGLMLIFVLVSGVIDLFGGFLTRFIVTTRGVRSISGKGARAAATTAIVGGILAGSLSGMAAGTLARSEQDVFIPYDEVSAVKVNRRRQYITVRGSWLQKPIGLYCRNDDFTGILHLLEEHCPSASFRQL